LAEWAGQAESSWLFRFLWEEADRPAPRPRLEKKGIRDGEVACLRADTHRQIKYRFVGPLARLLSGQGVGRIGRRAGLGRYAGEQWEEE